MPEEGMLGGALNDNVTLGKYLDDIEGEAPHTRDTINVKVYIGRIEGEIKASSEISEAKYFSKRELDRMDGLSISRRR